MLPVLPLLLAVSSAQDYRFPTSEDHAPFYYPTAYVDQGGVTDWACGSDTYSGHRGSDFGGGSWAGMDEGRDVSAAATGVVLATRDGMDDRCSTGTCGGDAGYGNYVKLLHPDGRRTVYAHLKRDSLLVEEGDVVLCSQKLGEMGSSGNSTGPHLHFEVRTREDAPYEPFAGDCGAETSVWVDQGDYGGIPALSCDTPPACAPSGLLTCGGTLTGVSDEAGSTTDLWSYGCTTYTYSGPERAFSFVTDRDEPVTLTLSGLSADLDLFVQTDALCGPSACLTTSISPDASSEEVTFEARAGVPYTIVVDGYAGAVSPYTLTAACEGGVPGGGDTGGADTASPGAGEEQPRPPEPDEDDAESGAVTPESDPGGSAGGCSTAPGGPGWMALLVFALGGRRRRA